MSPDLKRSKGRFQQRFRSQKTEIARAASWLGLGLLLLLLKSPAGSSDVPLYEIGQVADKTVLAPFTFKVMKSKAELEQEQEAAASRVPPVFREIKGVLPMGLQRLADLRDVVSIWSTSDDSLSEPEVVRTPGFTLSEATLSLLAGDEESSDVFLGASAVLSTILSGHVVSAEGQTKHFEQFVVVFADSSERLFHADSLTAVDEILGELGNTLLRRYEGREVLARAVYELSSPLVAATVARDFRETERRRTSAMEDVSSFRGTLLAGEAIVEAHYRVTDEDIQAFRSLRDVYAEKAKQGQQIGSILPVLGHLLFVVLFLVLLAASLRSLAPDILRHTSDTALMALIIALSAASSYAVRWPLELPATAVPLAASAMLATAFFGADIGFVLTMMILLLVASHFRFEVSGLMAPLAGALVAVFRFRHLRRRGDFFFAALWIFVASAIAGVTLAMFTASSGSTLVRIIGYSAANAAASSLIVMVAFPLLETLFHRTTDLRLLELSDMNHILLRQLALDAPGTYHHSMIVGNMAEAACEAMGANALLARVGSYYHDIGKLTKPDYFTENQAAGENPHDKLTPKMSALVIASHVKEGLKLARQEGLPPAIVDFIGQHHGSSSISFFYKKMLEQNPEARVNPEDFSYPGPKPGSRETAVVMLADASEGAVRALDDPNATRINQVVQKVIDERLTGGQLDECNLTFRDLGRIKESFVPILVGVHHHRVKYPDGKKEEQTEQK